MSTANPLAKSVVTSEGFVALSGGMSGGMNPMLLTQAQYSFGLNVTSRGGLVHTRPSYRQRVKLGEHNTNASPFGGCATYALSTANRIIYVWGGRIYGIRTDTLEIWDYSATIANDGGLMAENTRCFFCQADRYMIIQDGTSVPIILDDATARRAVQTADPSKSDTGVLTHPETYEVPIGTIMCYAWGRLFVVPRVLENGNDGRRYFYAGDITLPTNPASLLQFTETGYLNGGGAFGLPSSMGVITGMAVMQNAGTGTGQGALCVFAENGVSAFDVWKPREAVADTYGNVVQAGWQDVDISHVLFMDSGTDAPGSLVSINNDLYFRGPDGIRSINYTINETQGGSLLKNIPISQEVWPILKYDSQSVLPYVQMASVNNRLFCTSVPTNTNGEITWQSLVVMDADAQATLAAQAVLPIWDGAWTGLNILGIAVARHADHSRDALYMWAREGTGLSLYMLEDDGYVAAQSEIIKARIYSRGYTFGELQERKELQYVRLDVSAIQGDVVLRGYWRPTGFPYWCRMQGPGDNAIEIDVPSGAPQRRQGLRLTPFGNPMDPSTKLSLRFARAFEFCLEWEGYAQVDAAMFFVNHLLERPYPACGIETGVIPTEPSADFRDCDPFGPWVDPYEPFVPVPEEKWDPAPVIWTPTGPDTGTPTDPTTGEVINMYPPIWYPPVPPVTPGGGTTTGTDKVPWPGKKLPNPKTKPVMIMQASWNDPNTGHFVGTTASEPADEAFTIRVASTIENPVVTWTTTAPAGIELSQTSRTVMDCKTDPNAPGKWKGLSFFIITYVVACRAMAGHDFTVQDTTFKIEVKGTADNTKVATVPLTGRLTVTEGAHSYSFRVVCDATITRGIDFNLQVYYHDDTADVDMTSYTPQGPVLITLAGTSGEDIDITEINPMDWSAGHTTVMRPQINGGTGTREISIGVSEAVQPVFGQVFATVDDIANTLSLKVTCPLHVQRGEAFTLRVEGWNDITEATDATYVPGETGVVLSITAGDDVLEFDLLKAADFVDGVATVEMTITGGTGNLVAKSLSANDEWNDRSGTFEFDVSDHAPLTLTFSGYLKYNQEYMYGGSYLCGWDGNYWYYISPSNTHMRIRIDAPGRPTVIVRTGLGGPDFYETYWTSATQLGTYVSSGSLGDSPPDITNTISNVVVS